MGRIDFTDHASARKIGSVTIPCNAHQSTDVHLMFGATEISAVAENTDTGAKTTAHISYDI